MTPADDLTVRDYVAVVKMNKSIKHCSGEPLQILGISLPFICVVDTSGSRYSIDLRVVAVQRIHKDYVKACLNGANKATKPFPDDRTCPRCEGPLRKVLVAGQSDWHMLCEECNYCRKIE